MEYEPFSLDPRLEERLRANLAHHEAHTRRWLIISLCWLAFITFGTPVLPMRSPWWLLVVALASASWALWGFHRSAYKLLRHLMSAAWLEQHQGDMAPPIYGFLGVRFYI